MSWRHMLRTELRPRARYLAATLWHRLTAALVLLLVILIGIAMLGFDAQDASLNTSAAAPVENWLGRPGAFVADMAMQLMGHAVWLVLLPVGARAARQIGGHSLSHPNWRFIAACLAPLLVALALALGGHAASPHAPFPGGALGQLLADGREVALAALAIYPDRTVELSLAAFLVVVGGLIGLFCSRLGRPRRALGPCGRAFAAPCAAPFGRYGASRARWCRFLQRSSPVQRLD